MPRLLRISEDDLAELESILPQIADRLTCAEGLLDNPIRVKIRRVQQILTAIRWDYGPPDDVKILRAD